MKETCEFLVVRENTEMILYLNFSDKETKKLYLPGIDSVDGIRKQMAIEVNGINYRMQKETLNQIDITDSSALVDSGTFEIVYRSQIKFKFKLMGSYINQLFVMIAPSWGRWTKNRIWLMINTKY